ncbi:MAG TPA: DUF2232 domain-containing protein [Woeseiaceae bacterium]|nr:DUF2232 domain-containing protein [Woeseiaceae bacterium]
MRPIAAWLVARPQNAIIGLAGTLLLPFAQIISGTVMALLVLKQGPAPATVQGAIAVAILTVSSLIISAPVSQVLANAMVIWVPVMLLASLTRRGRSLTLSLQTSVIAAIVATVAFFVIVSDPIAFWTDALAKLSDTFRQMGLTQNAAVLYEQREAFAPQMTMLAVVSTWSLYAVVLLFGYGAFRALPGQNAPFGRFCDLNFGRVLAVIMAVSSVVSVLTGAVWLTNLAFVSFAVFWLQGLALVHWLHAEGRVPVWVVVLVYALIPLLNAMLVLALAVTGYADAWFGFRSRMAAAKN